MKHFGEKALDVFSVKKCPDQSGFEGVSPRFSPDTSGNGSSTRKMLTERSKLSSYEIVKIRIMTITPNLSGLSPFPRLRCLLSPPRPNPLSP